MAPGCRRLGRCRPHIGVGGRALRRQVLGAVADADSRALGLVTGATHVVHIYRTSGTVRRFPARWDGVICTFVPGMAPPQPASRQPGTAQRSVHLQRPNRIRTAARVVAAACRQRRRADALVQPDRRQENASGDRCSHSDLSFRSGIGGITIDDALRRAARKPDLRSTASWALDAVAAEGNARMTKSVPGPRLLSCSRTSGRRRRVTRWRTTEFPTFAETTKPARGGASCFLDSRWITKHRVPARLPLRTTLANSAADRRRECAGSTAWAVSTGSGRKLFAALTAASRQDGSAGSGPHPQTEAVDLRSATVVRLEGALAQRDLQSSKCGTTCSTGGHRTAPSGGTVPGRKRRWLTACANDSVRADSSR